MGGVGKGGNSRYFIVFPFSGVRVIERSFDEHIRLVSITISLHKISCYLIQFLLLCFFSFFPFFFFPFWKSSFKEEKQ